MTEGMPAVQGSPTETGRSGPAPKEAQRAMEMIALMNRAARQAGEECAKLEAYANKRRDANMAKMARRARSAIARVQNLARENYSESRSQKSG